MLRRWVGGYLSTVIHDSVPVQGQGQGQGQGDDAENTENARMGVGVGVGVGGGQPAPLSHHSYIRRTITVEWGPLTRAGPGQGEDHNHFPRRGYIITQGGVKGVPSPSDD